MGRPRHSGMIGAVVLNRTAAGITCTPPVFNQGLLFFWGPGMLGETEANSWYYSYQLDEKTKAWVIFLQATQLISTRIMVLENTMKHILLATWNRIFWYTSLIFAEMKSILCVQFFKKIISKTKTTTKTIISYSPF